MCKGWSVVHSERGYDRYHSKPMSLTLLQEQVRTLAAYWFEQAVLPLGKGRRRGLLPDEK